jgi:epoxyqueuosine reductase
VFSDSVPLLERAVARQAGLGFIGKNTMLIIPRAGSFLFLGEILWDLEISGLPNEQVKSSGSCGSCTRCIDSCPTGAFVDERLLDARRCISYLTIEKRGVLTWKEREAIGEWVFGCDVCQDVCPWNRFSAVNTESRFSPREQLLSMSAGEWKDLTEEVFEHIARRSPLKRKGLDGLRKNAALLSDATIGGK